MKIHKYNHINLCCACDEGVSGGLVIEIEENNELYELLICYSCYASRKNVYRFKPKYESFAKALLKRLDL